MRSPSSTCCRWSTPASRYRPAWPPSPAVQHPGPAGLGAQPMTSRTRAARWPPEPMHRRRRCRRRAAHAARGVATGVARPLALDRRRPRALRDDPAGAHHAQPQHRERRGHQRQHGKRSTSPARGSWWRSADPLLLQGHRRRQYRLAQRRHPFNAAQHGVGTQYFEVYGRLRLDRTWVEEHSLLQRNGVTVTTIWRTRGAGATTPPVKP
jgi:hypothetical protein